VKWNGFDGLSIEEIKRIENLLDTRPRKCIAYQTPNDIFHSTSPVAPAA
jgi:IS30 family transposase